MWNNIIHFERPTANNDQHRKTVEPHNKAVPNKVKYSSEVGVFMVESHSVSEKYYKVSYKDKCDEDGLSVFCPKCTICIHRYKCDWPDYVIKTTMCSALDNISLSLAYFRWFPPYFHFFVSSKLFFFFCILYLKC